MVRTIIIVLFILLIIGASVARADYPSDKLLQALCMKESGNYDKAFGDKNLPNHAYGCLQIRKRCVDDVNQKFGSHFTAEQCWNNHQLSVWICREYINMYATTRFIGHKPTDEDKARIWNGGPGGFREQSTIKYWGDLQRRFIGK